MRLSGPGFLWGVPVLGGLFTLVTAVILARVVGLFFSLVLILRVIIAITREGI